MGKRILFLVLIILAVSPFIVADELTPLTVQEYTPDVCKVQFAMKRVYLYNGTSWSDDLLGSTTPYIEINSTMPASEIVAYFGENLQTFAGTYSQIRVELESAVKIYMELSPGDGHTYYFKDGVNFDQDTGATIGIDIIRDDSLETRGWANMTLHSGYEIFDLNLLDGSGNPTTLSIADGVTSTIRTEINNIYSVVPLSQSVYTTNTVPSDTIRIIVQ